MQEDNEINGTRLWLVLAKCHRAIAQTVERSIANQGLCLSDFMVLETLLHKGPLTIGEIQVKVLLASGSMTAAVDRVEAKGLVTRGAVAADRRARLLALTAKGRRLIERVFADHTRDLEAATSVLNANEHKTVYEGLKKLGLFAASRLDRPVGKVRKGAKE